LSEHNFPALKPVARFEKPIIVMPAYNAGKTLRRTIEDIPHGCFSEIILVDDCSKDNTVELARSLGITVITHDKNQGYGANQKTCYDAALSHGADAVVMLHPDYQYDSRTIPFFLGFLALGICDVLLGSRVRSRHEAIGSGMPVYKYVSNRFLTTFENIGMGQNLADFHSGFRCYRREVLERIPYHNNSDDFVFDTQFLAQSAYYGFRIGDAPVPCRYFDEASSINFRRSAKYGMLTMWTVMQFWLQKCHLSKFRIFEEPH
jgi:glycosyltransferase involved in cell wall biosynthesis